ncbi:hypothetical protein BIW11_11402 [Tropilaelaps mercedesae]|uniref:Uncharacterized protein n=1 Tax=Tropilaelaps mercedesae TaxID=418985 RepID=A0A1V9XB72_9ACAR|nr:hypothetical protein BIW11_11402 [Tropilaelaps mercedesae]
MPRKKTRHRSPEIQRLLKKLPRIQEYSCHSQYLALLQFCIGDIDVAELCRYLERYRDDYNRSGWSSDVLDEFTGKCSSIPAGQIEKVCASLDRLSSVTRFLFSKFAFRKRAFCATGIVKMGYPARLRSQLDDSVLMVTFVEKLTAEMQRWREGDDTRVFKASVLYTRRPGLAVFSIDRYDTGDPTALPESSLIYAIDDIPSLFVVPYQTPLRVICTSLQTVLGRRMLPQYTETSAPLYQVIIDEAAKLGLRRDNFPDYVKELLHFQANTLRRLVRAPGFTKYPAQHACPFRTVTLEISDGFSLEIKARRGENLLEVLYEKEKANEISLPERVIQDLASGKNNVFKPFDLQ